MRRKSFSVQTDQRGVTYVGVMIAVTLFGITLMMVGQQWSLMSKRDREAELLFRGNRIKAAIEAYVADYEVKKGIRSHRYPLTLEELTREPKRYLQVVYKDPITGGAFDLIKVGSEIHGVKSKSHDRPLDKVHFKGAATYSQVTFQSAALSAQPCLPGVNPLNPLAASSCPPQTSAPPLTSSPLPTTPPADPGAASAAPATATDSPQAGGSP